MAIRHDDYEKIVTDNNILNANIHSLDSIYNNKTPLAHIDQKEPKEIEGFPSVAAAWKDVEFEDFESLKTHLEQLKEKQNIYHNNIKDIEDTRLTSISNVKRQKFDYFPFIDTIIRKAYKRGLIQEPEVEEEEKPEKVVKKRKKAPAKKPAKKRATRSKK